MIGPVTGRAGHPVVLRGSAGDFDKAIRAIEFSLDDKHTWTRYDVNDSTADRIVYWTFEYTPPRAGTYTLLVRSVNEDGAASPVCEQVDLLIA